MPRIGIIALFGLAIGVSACAYYDDYRQGAQPVAATHVVHVPAR